MDGCGKIIFCPYPKPQRSPGIYTRPSNIPKYILMFEHVIEFIIVLIILFVGVCCDEARAIPGKSGGAEKSSKASKSPTVIGDSPYITDVHREWMRGFTFIPKGSQRADWVLGLGIGSRATDMVTARLKSRMDSVEISDKVKFHEHVRRLAPHLIAATAELTRGEDGRVVPVPGQELPPGPWMMRANWGWKGLASGVATNQSEIAEWYDRLSSKPADAPGRSKENPRVLASEYIRDPLLYHGRKFHARVHILVVILKDRRYAVMCDTLQIITSGQAYVPGDWHNRKVHDSHYEHNPKPMFLEELPGAKTLRENTVAAMRELFGGTPDNLLRHFRLYPESPAACELFGADVMYREDQSVVVLEVNARPGLDDQQPYEIDLRDELFSALMRTAGVDVFGRGPFSPALFKYPQKYILL